MAQEMQNLAEREDQQDQGFSNAPLPVLLGAARRDVGSSKGQGTALRGADAAPGKGKSPSKRPPAFMFFLAGCAALNSINVGFDVGVSSGVALEVRSAFQLTDVQIGVFLGSLQFLAAIGALTSQFISDRFGRRMSFFASQVVLISGVALCVFSQSFAVLMAGQILLGIGVGLGFAIDPMYIAEVAPAAQRGMFTSWSDIAINVGIVFGFTINWAFAGLNDQIGWRCMMACGAVLPLVLMFLSLFVMPESPRWLVSRGRVPEATKILQKTHPQGDDVVGFIREIQCEVEAEDAHGKTGWGALLSPDRTTLKWLSLGIGIAIAQQLNGSESVVMYSPTIFARAHIGGGRSSLFAVTFGVGVLKTSFVVAAAFFVDSVGRRPLFILSTVAMALSLGLLALGTALQLGWLAVLGVCAFMASFSSGIGPVTFLLVAEMFPSKIRAKAVSLAICSNRLTSGAVALTFLPLASALGGQAAYFALFAALTALVALVSYCFVPETKQLTLEQLHQGNREERTMEA